MVEKKNEIDLNEIIDKLNELNGNIENLSYLKSEIEKIYLNNEKLIEFDKNVLGEEKNTNNNTHIDQIDYSLISKMINENEKYFGFKPRKIQIISLLFFLKKKKETGLIQQVDTGEGKSYIISFLAVYKAIKEKKKIDILTSSPVLAKRDVIKFKPFYKSFGLTVDYTSDHNEVTKKQNRIYTQDSFPCYNADIVYGDALSFEGDILRTNFMGIRGRGTTRNFDCIIVDEIDNLALDNLKNTTELLDSFHGYKFLEYVYLFIYKKLKEITDGKKENIHDKKEEIIEQLNKECVKEFYDLEKLKREKFVCIPNHLNKYIQKRLPDWCESAYIAKFVYHNNENYIKKKDIDYKISIINPIDFYNTGVTQENSVWSGLHQFLQIREKQMITEENLSSCYMSNLSFFNKYTQTDKNNKNNIIENNIYGLTGTIGSIYNKTTLNKLYKLDFLIIPPFKNSLLKIEKPNILIIKENKNKNNNINKNSKRKINNKEYEEKWFKNIQDKIIEIIGKKRAVLVIFQYISEALEMSKRLYNKYKNKIIVYSRSDLDEDKFLKDNIQPGQIILSTNLSGRGTDIKISPELNDNGGLHVILTYEPFNKRIERQAFGRAGRQGDNGSAGKIIISPFTQEEIINEINKREEEESEFLTTIYKDKIYLFERIFDKFSKFISEVNETTHNEILLLDLKERWGLFLIENNLNNIEKEYKKLNKSIDINTFKSIEDKYDDEEKKYRSYNYGYDFSLNDPKNIFKKIKNIYCNNWKKEYIYQNGLYLNKSTNIEQIKKGIKLCPELCLGGYMLILIKKIESIPIPNVEENYKIKRDIISNIKGSFDSLINRIELLIKQFKTYKTIIGFLGYGDANMKNMEITIQNEQKIELMTKIKELMSTDKEKIEEYERNNYSTPIFINRISLKKFIKNNNLNINQLIIDYFREYGLSLFEISDKKLANHESGCIIY